MALLPKLAMEESKVKAASLDGNDYIDLKKPVLSEKENKLTPPNFDDDDDFIPSKKRPKFQNPEEVKSMFEHSTLKDCTINIQYTT